MSSLVYLLVWSPPPHIPCISSPNQCLLFAAHAHTIATFFAVVSILYNLFLVSLSLNSLLGTLGTLTLHIHLTILISARWSATSFSFLTGQVSLPCSILLHIQNSKNSFCHIKGHWYNTQFLLYPRPLTWQKEFRLFYMRQLWALLVVIKEQFFIPA